MSNFLRHHPLPPRIVFFRRMLRSTALSSSLVLGSLALGAFGYHVFAHLPWLDSTLNAVMILTGMGPIDPLRTTSAKVFGIFYAMYSGVAFLTMVAVLFAPVVQRFLHRFHLELAQDSGGEPL